MKIQSPLVLALLSTVALLPATAFLVAGIIFFGVAVVTIATGTVFLPDGGLDYEFLYLSLSYVAGVFAIWQFWMLAIATVRGTRVPFCWRLGIAIACGCISAPGASLLGGPRTLAFVVLPVCVLVAWLLRLQYRRP